MIVIGASLGGIAALMHLAAELPRELEAPVLAVLHVGELPSLLPALLARNSRLEVAHARDDERPRPGHFYIAPPDHHMLVVDDRIVLTRGAKEHHTRPAIDPLFRSAALARGADVIGVVLTGMLDDGTAGLQEIKQRGGIAVVQDPDDALAGGMPASALENVAVDHCVPLVLLAPLLTSLVAAPRSPTPETPSRRPDHEQQMTLQKGDPVEHRRAIGKPSTFACPECHGALWEILDSPPQRFRCHTGHGFTARTLQDTLASAGEEAMSNAHRAPQEREVLLRETASRHRAGRDERVAATLEAAGRLQRQVAALKALIETSPEPIE